MEKTEEAPTTRLMELVNEAAEMGVREWAILGAESLWHALTPSTKGEALTET